MKKNSETSGMSFLVFRLIFRLEPVYLLWSAFSILVKSLLPILYVYAPKLILDSLMAREPFSRTGKIVLSYGVVLLVLNLLKTWFSSRQEVAAGRFSQNIRREIGKVALEMDFARLEDPDSTRALRLAGNATSITSTISYLGNMLSSVLTIIGLASIISTLHVWCLLSILVVTIVKYFLSLFQMRTSIRLRKTEAENNRIGNYLTGLLYFNPGAAKEVRVNALQPWMMKKVKNFRQKMLQVQYCAFRNDALHDALLTIAVALQSLLILGLLSSSYFRGEISIAEFTMLFSAVGTLTSALSAFGEQWNRYRQQTNIAADYKNLLTFVSAPTPRRSVAISAKTPSTEGSEIIGTVDVLEPAAFAQICGPIVFEHVSFAYPKSNMFALKDICLTIQEKEKLVIVGLNGSGKSTLVKLLCKFYRPTEGRITIGGVDIWDIPNSEYYGRIAAVFQDFANFAFKISENVFLDRTQNSERLAIILQELGVKYWNNADEIFLTKLFSDDGVDLSGGEGQKIAIARAIYREAPILLLDEPTASLNVKTEVEIYENFFKLSKNKTTIFISHRLACARIADNIAVFRDGQIAEYGTHSTLLRQGGLYAEMYQKQSSAYLSNAKQ